MIVRIVTPVPNKRDTLSVIAVDSKNRVVIRNIVENVAGATKEKNPELYGQLWDYTVVKSNAVFKNMYTNTYLSCQSGTSNNTPLILHPSDNKFAQWTLNLQDNMPGDDENAPRSYSIHASSNNPQVLDLTGGDTSEGTLIIMNTWKGQPPSDGVYNQFWFLEEARVVINNSTRKPAVIVPSNNTNETIEAWDAMVGGNLLGTIRPQDDSMTIDARYTTFYLSSKRNGNSGQRVNESENVEDQVITLVDGVPVTIQFYYGDPRQGASVTITATLLGG